MAIHEFLLGRTRAAQLVLGSAQTSLLSLLFSNVRRPLFAPSRAARTAKHPTQPSGPKLVNHCQYPLKAEPGTESIYPPSLDWSGRLIEHLRGQSLQICYLQQRVAESFSLTTVSFPHSTPWQLELLINRTEVTVRLPSGDVGF